MNKVIGAGGGGGKGDGGSTARAPVESPDSLRSRQYARVLDLLSEGEIVGLVDGLKSVYLDGTPIQNADDSMNFDGVTMVSRVGTQSQAYVPGFPAVESETSVGTEVLYAVPVTRTVTNENINAVRITVAIPRLTYQDTTTGDLGGTTVQIALDVQANGGGFVEVKSDTISGKTTGKYLRAYRIELTGDAPWDIRVRRITADSVQSNLSNETWWASYTEIIDAKLRYPNTALCALQIDAEQFRAIPRRGYEIKGLIVKIPSNYNPATRQYTGVWDGTFNYGWTDNPAWCFYDMLTSARYGLGAYIAPEQVDKWGLYDIAKYCDELVPDGYGGTEPRFTCNLFLQVREEAYRVIQNMASIFRGIAWWQAGAISVSADKPTDPSMLFTAANVADGKFSYSGSGRKSRHTVALVSWNDPEDQYHQKIEYVEDEVGIAQYGVVETEVLAFGCTSRGQAHRFGKWLLWSEIYETETETHGAGLDGTYLTPGTVYQTQDSVRAGLRFGGRVVAAASGTVTIDAPVAIEAGKTYALSCIMPDGTVETKPVTNTAGSASLLYLSEPFSQLPQVMSVWVLAANDLVPESWRLIAVAESSPGKLEVTGLAYNAGKYAAVEQGIALQPLPISTIGTGAPATPTGLALAESHYEVLTELRARVHVSWDAVLGMKWIVAWRRTDDNWIEAPSLTASWDIEPIFPGDIEVRVYAVSTLGQRSAPATDTITAVGTTGGPSDITGLVLEEPWDAPDCRLVWNELARADWYEVEVWESATLRATHKTSDSRFTYTLARNTADGGPWRSVTFDVYAIVAAQRSLNPASLTPSNPQLGAPTGVAWAAVIEGMTVSWQLPADIDYAGSMLWVSDTTGFDPAVLTPVYDGLDNTNMVAGLTPDVPYYARVACYDTFGKDSLTYSTEFSVTPRGVTADAATTLAEINALLTDGSGTDIIQMLADRFSIKSPNSDKVPFALVEVETDVWKLLLNSDVLIGGNVAIANLTEGSLPNDVILSLGDGVVQLDGAGEIRAYAAPGANQDFVSLTAAQLLFKQYIAGFGYVTYNYLSRIEAGTANNDDTVVIPGYWKEQPRVMVSPASLGLYKVSYANQDQGIQCQALSLQETFAGSGRWQFDAVATLNLSANTGSVAINVGSGDIVTNNWTSATYTTPANCANITPSVNVKSQRGNGSSQWFYRSIRWRVEYWSGSVWVPLTWRIMNMGAQFSALTDSGPFTFPSAASWQWRIYAEQYDTDGTVFGTPDYTYSQTTVGQVSGGSATANGYGSGTPATASCSITLGAATGSGEIYQIDYSWNSAVVMRGSTYNSSQDWFVNGIMGAGVPSMYSNQPGNNFQQGQSFGPIPSGYIRTNLTTPYNGSHRLNWNRACTNSLVGAGLTFNATYITASLFANATLSGQLFDVSTTLSGGSAVIKRRTPVPNSTTPVNNTFINSYNFTLTAAQVLASGTLNWMAMGR